jgi:hypothetical protein
MSHAHDSRRRLLRDALTVIRAIEEAIASNDPYNNLDYTDEYSPTLADCELPDRIEDPLALIRLVLGNEYAERVEYEGDLQLIAETLQRCVESELRKRTARRSIADFEAEGSDSEDDAPANQAEPIVS